MPAASKPWTNPLASKWFARFSGSGDGPIHQSIGTLRSANRATAVSMAASMPFGESRARKTLLKTAKGMSVRVQIMSASS